MTDCEALARFAEAAANSALTDSEFVRDFGVLTPNVTVATLAPGIASSISPVALWTSGEPSGYASQFQNTLDDTSTGNGDQGHHFAAYFQFGWNYGASAGSTASWWGEQIQALKRGEPLNQGDVNLGIAAAMIGSQLASGAITADQVGGRIRDVVCKK